MGLKTKFKNYFARIKKIEALKKDFSEKETKALKNSGNKKTISFNSPEKPLVSIIICWNKEIRPDFFFHALKERTSSNINFEVIVVAENSNDKYDFSKLGAITLLDKNGNFIEKINHAIHIAKGEYLYFLSNQLVVSENYLEEAISIFNNFPDAGIVGSQIISKGTASQGLFFDGKLNESQPKPAYYPDLNHVRRVDFFSEFSFVIKRTNDFGEVIQLNETLGTTSFAIADLCFDYKFRQHKQAYLTPFSKVYGLKTGIKSFSNSDKFIAKWKDAIQTIKSKTADERIEELYKNKSIIFFSGIFPEHDKDSGSNRLKEIIEGFYDLGYLVTIVSKNTLFENPYIERYLRMGISVFYEHDDKISTEKYIENQKLNPEKVWFYGPNSMKKYFNTIEKNFSDSKTIFDMIDVHFLRYKRALELHPNRISIIKRYKKYFFIETQIAKNVDLVVAISDIEKKVMSEYLDEAKIITISNIHYPKTQFADVKSFEDKSDLIFIGSAHTPNIDAIYYIYQEIMPLVWEKLPGVNLKIVGNVNEHINDINHPNVQFLGYVQNIEEIFNDVKMMVAPLRYGAGVKGKIGQAFEYYLPVVTTEIGAEGMFLENGENALIADDALNFANSIIELYQNKSLWEKLSNNSEKSLYPFSKEKLRETILEI